MRRHGKCQIILSILFKVAVESVIVSSDIIDQCLAKAKTPESAGEAVGVCSRVTFIRCYAANYSLSSIIGPIEGLSIETSSAWPKDCY